MHPQLLEASILGHGVRKEGFFGRVTFVYQRWSVLECVGVCWSVLECVAEWCRVLQIYMVGPLLRINK